MIASLSNVDEPANRNARRERDQRPERGGCDDVCRRHLLRLRAVPERSQDRAKGCDVEDGRGGHAARAHADAGTAPPVTASILNAMSSDGRITPLTILFMFEGSYSQRRASSAAVMSADLSQALRRSCGSMLAW